MPLGILCNLGPCLLGNGRALVHCTPVHIKSPGFVQSAINRNHADDDTSTAEEGHATSHTSK